MAEQVASEQGPAADVQESVHPQLNITITPTYMRGPGGVRAKIILGDDGASAMSSVFTLCNSAIGAGVLSLPYAFRLAGVVGCAILCVVLGVIEALSQYSVAKFAERYQARSYGILIRKALGKKLAATLSCLLVLYLWGSCIAYLIIVGDTFSSLLVEHIGECLWSERRFVIGVLGFVVILPMCFPRDLKALHWVSMAAVVGFLYTAACIVLRSSEYVAARTPHFRGVHLFHWDAGFLFAIPIVVFGFNCHANVVTIFHELQQYPDRLIGVLPGSPRDFHALPPGLPRPRTHKLIGMLGVIFSGMTLIMVGYLAVGFAGYLAYPTKASSNILNNFPSEDPLMQVARGVIGVVVVGHYPINHHPARLASEDLMNVWLGWDSVNLRLSSLLTVVFVGSTIGVSMRVTDLGVVLHMIGGTVAAFIIFFLPGLLLLNASIIKESASSANLADAAEGTDGDLDAPLLPGVALSKKAGLRESGLIYSPRKSWWIGVSLIVISVVIFTITLYTAFVV